MTFRAQSLAKGSAPVPSFELATENRYLGLTIEEPEENEETNREHHETQELEDTLWNHETDGNR